MQLSDAAQVLPQTTSARCRGLQSLLYDIPLGVLGNAVGSALLAQLDVNEASSINHEG
jgi:hypothetical protein